MLPIRSLVIIVVIIMNNVVTIPFILKIGNYNALMADCPAYQKFESVIIIIISIISIIMLIRIEDNAYDAYHQLVS